MMNYTAFTKPPTTTFLRHSSNRNPVKCAIRSTKMIATPSTPTPTPVKSTDTEIKTKTPNMYRLYIINDPVNRRERVIDVLLKTCQGLSFSRAYAAMQEAHENGKGLVLVIAQEIAEHYSACINSAGVLSTIEPDS